MNRFFRMLCLILCFALLLGLLPMGFAAELPFGDVPEGSWFAEAVEYVYRNGLMNGTAGNTFSPELSMSRGMIVAVLYRLEGSPEPSAASPFEDVPGWAYYKEAIDWSYENGIVKGISEREFAPDADVTREQLVTIFYRYANAEGYDTTSMHDLSAYEDEYQVSSFARNALGWAVESGIIKGVTDTTLVPQGNANRAQFAVIMQRFAEWKQKRNAPATVLTAEKGAELRENLQNAIDNILYTETEIVHSDTFIPGKTYTGTAYYVSNDGDDNNDGLTPETAWQSMGKLLGALGGWDQNITLQPGDAVFLRRGDIFRLTEWSLTVPVDQITFSAYGGGDKPILTCSSENGTGAEKWELVHEDATGKKIWKYYRDMRDISMVVLNDGEAITKRVYEFYDGTQYLSCEATGWWMHEDEGVTLLGGLLPLEESMTEDLTIISRPVRTSAENNYSECGDGPLYLRCDRGNPGALYDSIEFSEYLATAIIWLEASDVVLDNISFRCNGNSFVKANTRSNEADRIHWSEYTNTVIQNCEFAYGGGCVTYYHISPSGKITVEAQGDGIYTVVKNTTIRNNYFHDSMSTTTTYEWALDDERTSDGYYHVLDNVMVNTFAIRLDSTAVSLKYLDSVIVRGNQIWNTGEMDNHKIVYSEGSLILMPNYYREAVIEDNVFYGSKYENAHAFNALLNIELWDYDNLDSTHPILRNNVYVQYSGRKFGNFNSLEKRDWYIDDPDLVTMAAEYLGDTTSEFYVIK